MEQNYITTATTQTDQQSAPVALPKMALPDLDKDKVKYKVLDHLPGCFDFVLIELETSGSNLTLFFTAGVHLGIKRRIA
jgi:hypothetical protein